MTKVDRLFEEEKIEAVKIIVTGRYLPERASFAELSSYANAVEQGGGAPVSPGDDARLAAILRGGNTEGAYAMAELYDGLLLSGGGDIAARFFNQESHPAAKAPDERLDAGEISLCRAFIRANKPVLGICRGMQVINVAMGGGIIQDIPALLGLPPKTHNDSAARHTVNVKPGTWLYSLFGPKIMTNSMHHQCVDGVAAGFTIAAQAGPVIEAMEGCGAWAVQFHPERMLGEGMLAIFEDFIKKVKAANGRE